LEFIEAGWCFLFAENHGWKWAKSFFFIAFDPGGTLPLSKWLLPVFHTIHNLEAASVVFDPGGKIVTTIISRYIGPWPSELGFVLDVNELDIIVGEPVAVPELGKKLSSFQPRSLRTSFFKGEAFET